MDSFYTDYARLIYLKGVLETLVKMSKADDACESTKEIGEILENALARVNK